MKLPNELNEYQAKILIAALLPEEHDVFIGFTHWTVTIGSLDVDGHLNLDIIDTKREYGSTMHSSVLITNMQVFLLAQELHFVLASADFEGWELGQRDTKRMASIEIELSQGKGKIEFKIQKDRLEEFRDAMLNLGKPEIDHPTNEAFFDSHWIGPSDEAPVGEVESKHVSSEPSRFLISEEYRPRH